MNVDPVTGDVVENSAPLATLRVIFNCNRCGKRLASWATDPGAVSVAPSGCPRCDIAVEDVLSKVMFKLELTIPEILMLVQNDVITKEEAREFLVEEEQT